MTGCVIKFDRDTGILAFAKGSVFIPEYVPDPAEFEILKVNESLVGTETMSQRPLKFTLEAVFV